MRIGLDKYSWRQTEQLVLVRVSLGNVPHSKVDVFTSDQYIKIHFPPFLFEVCLFGAILEEDSKCTLARGEATFELRKAEPGVTWTRLDREVSRSEALQMRQEAIQRAHRKAEKEAQFKKETKDKKQKECVRKQMMLDERIREKMKGMKDEEKRGAVEDLMRWKERETESFLPEPITKARARLLEHKRKASIKVEVGEMGQGEATDKDIFGADDVRRDGLREKKGEPEMRSGEPEIHRGEPEIRREEPELRPLRQCGRISTQFTYRAFPTPSRESKLTEEQEWLKKQAEARRRTGFVAEDLRPEEEDPDWLLRKGRGFQEVGNSLGAISAYTHAIQRWDRVPELYLARSESHLAVGNLRRALRDTSQAIDLLKPYVAANEDLRFMAHLNRGRALLELGMPVPALADLTDALELRPDHGAVINLMDRAERLMEQPPPPPAPKEYIETEDLAN